jgi:iron(III) transport system substrate-binding protein
MTGSSSSTRARKDRPRSALLAFAAVALLGASVALSGCGSSSGVSIVLYSGQHEETVDAIVSAFEHQTGINVVVRSQDEDLLADQIVTEGANSPADVIWTENSPALEFLEGRNLLAPLHRSTLDATPSRFNSPLGDWVGVSARVSVLIYNPSLISIQDLPTTVLQLADHRYRGELAFAAGETDFQPIVTAVDRAYGHAAALRWLQGIAANVGTTNAYPDSETIANEVNRGAVAFGVVNQYYWYRMRAEIGASSMHSKLAYFAPRDPGYVVDVSGAGVLRSTHHMAAAQRLVAFLVGATAQAIIANPKRSASFEYPIASGSVTSAHEIAFGTLQPYPITIAQLGDGSIAISLLRAAGLL